MRAPLEAAAARNSSPDVYGMPILYHLFLENFGHPLFITPGQKARHLPG
jgi:hypothetical protein